ncbi:MAG: hypothetical protein VW268_07150 [Rhodospirillaceae bacterium]
MNDAAEEPDYPEPGIPTGVTSTQTDEDRDALHILPLIILPFQKPSLKRARLIKNARLESVVELFKGSGIGSGQMTVEELAKDYGWAGKGRKCHPDLVMLRKLSPLPSYDVYSLRILLRQEGIEVNSIDDLKLSEGKIEELTKYMTQFTRPLIQEIYGKDDLNVETFDDLVKLFYSPDVEMVRKKLDQMAQKLRIKTREIPKFLEDFGDLFLSLSYFRQCLDTLEPIIDEFKSSMEEIRDNFQLKTDVNMIKTCNQIEGTINELLAAISGRLETFDRCTNGIWDDLTADRFMTVKKFVEEYHTTIGGCLCALTAKMNAFAAKFPSPTVGGPIKRGEFIMSEMKQGIDKIREIQANAPEVETLEWAK